MDIVSETIKLVSLGVANGASTEPNDVAEALRIVGAAIAELANGVRPVAAVGAEEYRASVNRGMVTCLECGEEVQALGMHCAKAHGMNWADYVGRWGWWFDREGLKPLRAGAVLSAKRRDTAIMVGLGNK